MCLDMDRETQAHWGRIGGLTKASRYPAAELTAPARRGFAEKWRRQVDPDGVLEPAERERRAVAAQRAYFVRLAMSKKKAPGKSATPGASPAAPLADVPNGTARSTTREPDLSPRAT